MDPENVGKEAIIRVTDWLRGIWEMRRNTGQVQQWVDSIPCPGDKALVDIQIEPYESPISSSINPAKEINTTKTSTMTLYAPMSAPGSPAITMSSAPSSAGQSRLARDPSLQSDSSHCSSVESLLELRKPDPEAILLDLGFGGCSGSSQTNGSLSRIPKRFLRPSKLRGITIEDFVKQQHATSESIDSTFLGYRGLTGSPYVAPSEIVQKIMQRLREHESHELEVYSANNQESCYFTSWPEGRLSVLSPDNRQYLERQRSRSPDMRRKRMIIGQKSFAFSGDGDLIEINPNNESTLNTDIQDNSESLTTDSIDANKDTNFNNNNNNNSNNNNLNGENIISIKKRIEKQKPVHSSEFESSASHSESESSIENKLIVDCYKDQYHTDSSVSVDLRQSKNLENYKNNNQNKFSNDLSNNSRRASDSCRDVTTHSDEDIRRFSDGGIKLNSARASDKRRSFRRQARINDVSLPSFSKEPECSHLVIDAQIDLDNAQSEDAQSEKTSKKKSNQEKRDLCNSNEGKQTCKHGSDMKDCCCHTSSPSCWRKMRKIIKKNEKLESMVVNNRREMAEIRDMLSNVLSVKMEPGF